MIITALIASVLIGSILGWYFSKSKLIPSLLLTFSGAFLLTVTLLEIFPKIYTTDFSLSIGLFILLGVFIQILLEGITKGAEHGHIHKQSNKEFPKAIFIGLFLHAFIEGIPLHSDTDHHLLIAIVIHKIPVALILFTFISELTPKWQNQALFMLVFALASPLGFWFGDFIPVEWLMPALAIVAGIFLHISTVIIFESSDNHKLKQRKIISLALGFVLAYLTLHQH